MITQRPSTLVPLLFAALLLHLHPTSTLALIDPTAYASPGSAPAPAPAAVTTNSPSATTTTTANNDTEFIRSSCQSTRYPELCFSSLSGYSSAVQQDPGKLARAAIAVSLSRAKYEATYFNNLSKEADYGAEPRAASAVHDCFSFFQDAVDQMHGSLRQMRHMNGGSEESFRFQMSNVQTWMSAALTNEDTCTDGFEDVPEGAVKTDVCNRVSKVEEVTSNALALINNYADKVSTP